MTPKDNLNFRMDVLKKASFCRHFENQVYKNAQAKNINTDARQTHGEVNSGGFKVKVLGESSNDFKFKIKNQK